VNGYDKTSSDYKTLTQIITLKNDLNLKLPLNQLLSDFLDANKDIQLEIIGNDHILPGDPWYTTGTTPFNSVGYKKDANGVPDGQSILFDNTRAQTIKEKLFANSNQVIGYGRVD
jgi:hypothetical protein